jgi:anti-repressor protein
MNELRVFENAQFGQVRTVMKDGQPWFVAADVCRALEINDNRSATARLDEDEKDAVSIRTLGGDQKMSIINEPGLYALVLGSRKPEAKAFKRWITHEVIPSIRRHGAYATVDTIDRILGDPDFGIRLLSELKQERERTRQLEQENAAMRPKALFADAVSAAQSSILIGDLAKLLKQNGVPTGANRLFDWLRNNGYLSRQRGESWNMPTQRSMEMGLVEVVERTLTNPDGSIRLTRTTKVTGKGQQYFINHFLTH